MTAWKVLFPTLALALFLLTPIYSVEAAQDAYIGVVDGEVRANPEEGGTVVTSIPSGTAVRVSDVSKNGYYKVLLSEPVGGVKAGWIREDYLAASPSGEPYVPQPAGKKGRRVKRRPPSTNFAEFKPWSISGLVGAAFTSIGELQDYIGAGATKATKYGFLFGVEGGYRFNMDWSAAVQVSYFSLSTDITGTTAELDGSYGITGINAVVLAEYAVMNRPTLRIHVGAGGGMGLSHKLSMVVNENAGNQLSAYTQSFESSVSIPIFLGRASARWIFDKNYSLNVNLGYRMMSGAEVDAVRPDASVEKIPLNLSGIFADIGVSFSF
jgi:hypothetical protein